MFGAGDLLLKNQQAQALSGARINCGVFTPPSIKLRSAQVLRLQGYRDLSQVHPKILSIAEAMTALAQKIFQPTVHFRCVNLNDLTGDILVLDDGAEFHSGAFGKYLANCTHVAVFVMTLGATLDEVEHEMTTCDRLVETVFLETAGRLGIEQLTKLFTPFLRDFVAPDGLEVGRRMSPGYSFKVQGVRRDWPLKDQKALFNLFNKETLTVKLLDSCAMSPKMSRSGLFGLHAKKSNIDLIKSEKNK